MAGLVLSCILAVTASVALVVPGSVLPFALGDAAGTAPHQASTSGSTPTSTVSAPGCGNTAQASPGATTAETLQVGSVLRHYAIHVPASYDTSTPIPLLLSFHGRGSNPSQHERFTGFSLLADRNGFIVVYPQGAVSAAGETGWNTGRRQDPTTDDLRFVDTLLTHLQQTFCIDTRRIYATGFSNGGGLIAILACAFADRIAAFAPVAGDYYPQPSGCHPARPASLLELHGTRDATNPYEGSSRLHYPSVSSWLGEWAARDGCQSGPVVAHVETDVATQQWTDCRDGATIVHYRLAGLVHTWPSHDTLARLGGGFGSFDAATAIWSFFAGRSLPMPETTVGT